MKKTLYIMVFVLSANLMFAQQDFAITHYMYNSLNYNPAYAGITGSPTFGALYRNQWLGYSPSSITTDNGGNQTAQIISAQYPLVRYKAGVGLNLVNDKLGPQRTTAAQLSLSKHIKIKSGKLGIGIQGNYNLFQYGLEGYRPPDGVNSIPLDVAIPQGENRSFSLFDMAAGLWYESNTFFGGVSMNKLTEQAYKFTKDSSGLGGQRRHLYINAGYRIEAGYDLIIIPTLLLKSSLSNKGSQFEFGGMAEYKETYSGGLNFRQGEGLGLLLGMKVLEDKSLRVGYSIDFVMKETMAKKLTSHEITLIKTLPPAKIHLKPAIRTPRFRF